MRYFRLTSKRNSLKRLHKHVISWSQFLIVKSKMCDLSLFGGSGFKMDSDMDSKSTIKNPRFNRIKGFEVIIVL